MLPKTLAYFTLIKVLKFMKDNGLMVWLMAKELVFMQMGISLIKGNGMKANDMEKGLHTTLDTNL